MTRTTSDPSFRIEARGRRFPRRPEGPLGLAEHLIVALLAGAMLLAGCSAGAGGPTGSSGAVSIAPASPTFLASATARNEFPIALVDDEGSTVTVPTEPRRIVSLTPGITEILFALGLGDWVVATDSASDYPAEAAPLPDVAAFGALDVEKIVDLRADLVVAGGNGYTPPQGIATLRSLGLPVLVVYGASVDGVIADVELIGRAVGRALEGTAIAASIRADIESLTAAVREQPEPRVFYEIDASNKIYGPADRSFLAEMVALAGGAPITSGSADNFEIPLERLISANPEVIVLGDVAFGATPEIVAQRPGWGRMTAVQQGAIRPVDDKLVTRAGPRLPQGLRSLILAIHPDARLP